MEVETVSHMLWRCPENSRISAFAVTSTNGLPAEQALVGAPQVFLCRGLVPQSFAGKPPEPAMRPCRQGFDDINWQQAEQYLFATDGSGGKNSSRPEVRRAGWAWVAYHISSGAVAGCSFGPLPGAIQTVPRAELFALGELLRAAGMCTARVNVYTDHANAVVFAERGFTSKAGAANQDLLEDLAHAAERINVKIRHVSSHVAQKEMKGKNISDAPKEATSANEVADLLAQKGTEQHQVPEELGRRHELLDTYAGKVLLRGVAIAKAAMKMPTDPARISVRPPPPKEPLWRRRQRAILNTTHSVHAARGGLFCAV